MVKPTWVRVLIELGGDVVGTVFVADDLGDRQPAEDRVAALVIDLSGHRVEALEHVLVDAGWLSTLDGWSIPIGVANARMSASMICRRRPGQASPSPSSADTPRLIPWSAARWVAVTLCFCRARMIFCVDDAAWQ